MYSSKLAQKILPYVAGEQPQDMKYIKINTNENPYGPSKKVEEIVKNFNSTEMRLYPDPNNTKLTKAIAKKYGVNIDNIFIGNGSDEVLAMCFPAFFDPNDKPIAFPDITYSFYKVWANMFNINIKMIPLDQDFVIRTMDYTRLEDSVSGIIIANPNAPTSISMKKSQLISIIETNIDKVVIIDEAYADFSDYSMVNHVKDYENLLVVRTFSKSYSLAGARCGFAIGNRNLISTLNKIKNSINSYTVNRMTEAIAIEAINDEKYFKDCTNNIIKERSIVVQELSKLNFHVLDSKANFVFVKHNSIPGEKLYKDLKKNGILVRHFNDDRIKDYLRITIGTPEEMDKMIAALEIILK